jgi:hypothetical protein
MIGWDDIGYRLSGTRTGWTWGLGPRNYDKKGNTRIFFKCTHFFTVDCVAMTPLNIASRLRTSFSPLPLTLFALSVSSSLLHSLSHVTRLVIASPVHTFPASPHLAWTWSHSPNKTCLKPFPWFDSFEYVPVTWVTLTCTDFYAHESLKRVGVK